MRTTSVRPLLLLIALATALVLAASLAAPSLAGSRQAAKRTQTWVITTNGVGPLKVSMNARQAIRTGHFKRTKVGCGIAARGRLARALDPWFYPEGTERFMKVYVRRASVKGFTFRTRHGVTVGTTVRGLLRKEKVKGPTGHIYEHGYTYYKGRRGHWITFVIDSQAPSRKKIRKSDRIESIVVSRQRILGGGGC